MLTPELGLEGPALATAIPFLLAFPLLVRVGLNASGARLAELARRAWLPAYSLGALLAATLVVARLALDPDSLLAVVGLAAGGLLAYWGVFSPPCSPRASAGSSAVEAEHTVGDQAGQREGGGGRGGRRVAHVERALGLRQHEVVHEAAVAGERLRPDPGEAAARSRRA